ncbi:MAG: UPF0280 family protein [Rhodopseudomonas sp.]|uniref:UPF0280 family protein n=1 Tax=Rhodopseudomonas sp. TaxID=1078 RepID=UPI0039E725D2
MGAASQLRSPAAGRAIQAALLADGRRLHLHDGPIDLIIEATGEPLAVRAAYVRAADRFAGLLDALCAELPGLRAAAGPDAAPLAHVVARRMQQAVAPFAADVFITPMAAVAGAVAEHVLQVLIGPGITRGYVNNGGDIALHLPPGATTTVGLVARPDRPAIVGTATIDHASPIRGIATSGWRGRSFSLGIADAVTVLAPSAAMADAAATVIANAVDLPDHPGIVRVPACELQPDNDLGARLVTRNVPELSTPARAAALDAGLDVARNLAARGLICDAALHLQGETVSVGTATLVLQPHQELADA